METVRLMLILVGRERLRIAGDVARKHLNDNETNESSMSIYGKIFSFILFKMISCFMAIVSAM